MRDAAAFECRCIYGRDHLACGAALRDRRIRHAARSFALVRRGRFVGDGSTRFDRSTMLSGATDARINSSTSDCRRPGPSGSRFLGFRREWPAQYFGYHALAYRAVDMTMPDQIVGEIFRRDTAESLDPVVEANLCGSGRAYVDEPRIFP